jgi:hypothetical protein
MCTSHDSKHEKPGMSRRNFGTMALAGASSLLLPRAALAADPTDALSIMCIDHRFVTRTINFFNMIPPAAGTENYDLAALAGASLAGVAEKEPVKATVPAFWVQVDLAVQLHTIHRVVLLDHMECGAYWNEFNNGNRMTPDDERRRHLETWPKVAAEFHNRARARRLPPLMLDFFLMEMSGAIGQRRHYPPP